MMLDERILADIPDQPVEWIFEMPVLPDWHETYDARTSDMRWADAVEEEAEVRQAILRLRAQGVQVSAMQIEPRRTGDVDWARWERDGLADVRDNFLFQVYRDYDRDEYGDWQGWCEMVASRALVRAITRISGAAKLLTSVGVPLDDAGRLLLKQDAVQAFLLNHDQDRNQHPFLYTTALYNAVSGSQDAVRAILRAYCAAVRAAWEADLTLLPTPLPDEEDYFDAGYGSKNERDWVTDYKQHGSMLLTSSKYNVNRRKLREVLGRLDVPIHKAGRRLAPAA